MDNSLNNNVNDNGVANQSAINLNSNEVLVKTTTDNNEINNSSALTNATTNYVDELLSRKDEANFQVDNSSPEDLDVKWSRWRCLVCGYNYEGRNQVLKCPRCSNIDPDKFEDAD